MTLHQEIDARLGTEGVELQAVYLTEDVAAQISEALAAFPMAHQIAILMDTTPYVTAHGDDLKDLITKTIDLNRNIIPVVLTAEVHADEATVSAATRGCATADVVVTIGSGTLCDIGKVAAGTRPHIVVQTAASVNGFADDQSVLLIRGAKRTTPSAWPHTLVISPEVLSAAPVALNRSGLGDMISMFTAPADWYASQWVAMDRGYDHATAVMTRRHGHILLEQAPGIGSNDPLALTTLAQFVTLSGISMGVAGQTAPSSGMEHTISHLIDMAHGASGQPNAFHGEQVGVATIVVSLLWHRIVSAFDDGAITQWNLPSRDDAEQRVHAAFDWMDPSHTTAAECWSDYLQKHTHLARLDGSQLLSDIQQQWHTHRQTLDELLIHPRQIVAALRAAGAPTRFADLSQPVDQETVVWALSNCHLMRNRFTVADFAALTGRWERQDILALLAEAEALSDSV